MMSHLDQLHKSVYYSVLSLVLLLVGASGLPAQTGQRFKQIDYNYDLISGKVNEVLYQANQPDAFYHKYEYDADNRITKVHTSKDDIIWDQDASYTYYAHGPLARVELGDNKVQGMDYAYTLQGWIKGVNSNLLKAENDMGNDGLNGSAHSRVAKDAFGYSLNYHANDYQPIDAAKWSNPALRFEALTPNSDLLAARFDLHNGNISSMVTTIVEPKVYTGAANEVPNILPQGMAYKYDQLNRLLEMKAFQNLDVAINKWKQGSTYAGLYHNTFKYDANGNILYQERAGQNGLAFDKLTYWYKTDAGGQRRLQNRLYHVNDGNTNTALATDDIEDQGNFTSLPNINGVNNYRYDEIGNLKHDAQEEIDKIEWTVYGKIKSITRTAVSLRSDLEFQYDASGNRIAKIEKPRDANGVKPASEWIATYYARDAQGNVMGIYKHRPLTLGPSFKLMERNLYGSSRLGSDDTEVELISPLPIANPLIRVLGNKHFEESNHLGNVLAVVSDRKIPRDDDGDGVIDYFQGEVLSAQDYSPFGVFLDGRSFGAASRYGFNGKEKDDEVKREGKSYNFGERQYDPRIGRWTLVDPLFTKYPSSSPYNFGANSPVFVIDPDGGDIIVLSAPNAVNGLGHAAVLIGNDKEGWTLYSKNGTYGSVSGSGSSGEANKHPQNGVYVGSLDNFALNYNLSPKGELEYKDAFKITTSKETDAKMAAAASKQVGSWYDVTGQVSGSCIDVATDALEAGGLNGGTVTKMIPQTGERFESKSPIPNERYEQIKKSNKGTNVTQGILPSKEQIAQRVKEFQKSIKVKYDMYKEILDKRGNKEGDLAPNDKTTVAPILLH